MLGIYSDLLRIACFSLHSSSGDTAVVTLSFALRGARVQVKTSLDDGAERSMLTSDEHLLAAMSWAEEQGLGLNVFLDVVSGVLRATHFSPNGDSVGPRSGAVSMYIAACCVLGLFCACS